MGDFGEKIEELQKIVGDGDLQGSVEYDQVYAHYQHEGIEFRHPQGGQAKFLEVPMQERHQEYLQKIADEVLEDGGREAMIRAMEDLALKSSELAPIGPAGEHGKIEALHPGLLRASAHPTVEAGGEVIYDQPGAPRKDHDTHPGDNRGGNRRGPKR